MCTFGKPPIGVGVNCGRIVRWLIPFWLRAERFASASVR